MLTHRCWRGWDRGVSLGQEGRNWGHTCMAGKGPAWRPEPPSRGTLMGTLGGGRGVAWVLGWGEPCFFKSPGQRQDKTETYAWLGAPRRKSVRGPSCFFSKPWWGCSGWCVPEAAPRPEWSQGAGVGVSPPAIKPHLSPQEHRVLTNSHSALPTGCPGLGGVPGALAGTGSRCDRSPPSRSPGAPRRRDVVPMNCEVGLPPGLRLGSGRPHGRRRGLCGLLLPLTPAQVAGTSPSPRSLQGATCHQSCPGALLCSVCVHTCACHQWTH